MNLKSANYLFFKKKILQNNKITNDWNSLNLLSSDAATVGSLDLDIIDESNEIFQNLKIINLRWFTYLEETILTLIKKMSS